MIRLVAALPPVEKSASGGARTLVTMLFDETLDVLLAVSGAGSFELGNQAWVCLGETDEFGAEGEHHRRQPRSGIGSRARADVA